MTQGRGIDIYIFIHDRASTHGKSQTEIFEQPPRRSRHFAPRVIFYRYNQRVQLEVGDLPVVLCEYATTTRIVLVSTYPYLHTIPLQHIILMRPFYEQPVVTRGIDNKRFVPNSQPFFLSFSPPLSLSLSRSRLNTHIYTSTCAHFWN